MADPETPSQPLSNSGDPHQHHHHHHHHHRGLHKLRQERCIRWCGWLTAILLLLTILIIILASTVFRVKDPTIKMNSVSIQRLEISLGTLTSILPSINMTLLANLSVKNPNAASFRFGNTTTTLLYGGVLVGEARTPPGAANARRTFQTNVTVDIIPARIVGVQGLAGDLISGQLTVESRTKVGGQVKICFVKKHVDVQADCRITLNVSNQSIHNIDCKRHVSV